MHMVTGSRGSHRNTYLSLQDVIPSMKHHHCDDTTTHDHRHQEDHHHAQLSGYIQRSNSMLTLPDEVVGEHTAHIRCSTPGTCCIFSSVEINAAWMPTTEWY